MHEFCLLVQLHLEGSALSAFTASLFDGWLSYLLLSELSPKVNNGEEEEDYLTGVCRAVPGFARVC